MGYDIIIRACRAPLTDIASNAGKDGGIVCEKVLEAKGNIGYNAATDVYEDLVKAGVIDPTKVTRTALQNAASVATLAADQRCPDRREAEEGRPRRAAAAVTAAITTCINRSAPPVRAGPRGLRTAALEPAGPLVGRRVFFGIALGSWH